MELTITSRLKQAWNVFMNKDPTTGHYRDEGRGYSRRPDRARFTRGNNQSIVTSVYNRIALDAASINIQHVQLDENKRFLSVIESGMNNCFNVEANVDQTGRSFIQDVVMSMLDEGCVAIVPTDTTTDHEIHDGFDIDAMRTGQVIEWKPKLVRVRVYNENTGLKEDITVPKNTVAIIENPLYAVINEPNSTMQRLIRKLNLLDAVDEQSSSGKLNLIIQLPYVIKTEARRQQAENRRIDIENQLFGSKYGIAYTDGTERITQLNRSVENNLMSQIEYLTSMLYSQLGITQSILDGTADDKTMLNYYNRTIEPIVSAVVDDAKRKFLTKTARLQAQSITFFRDPFKLVPVNELADIVDKFTRNEVMTSNEFRPILGLKPSTDPKADELRNKNISAAKEENGVTEEMTHHGILGQKWGVRRTREQLGRESLTGSASPKELLQYLRDNVKYEEYKKLKSPLEVLRSSRGSCHDQVMLELEELSNMGLKPKAEFFIEYDAKTGQGGTTHSFVYWDDGKKTYWLENAWGGQEGIHEYDSLSDIKLDILRLRSDGRFGDRESFAETKFSNFGSHVPGETLQTLVDKSLKEENSK